MSEAKKGQETIVPALRAEPVLPSMTRRRLLTGVGQAALLTMAPVGCMPAINAPWADGTFWDDGKGWAD
ncbi:MAG: hypothetical protein ACR2P3_02830 [Geminicoccaceae bacterium]